LCFLSLCAIVFRSPPASHVSSSNGQWSSQLFCVHYTHHAQPQYIQAPPNSEISHTTLRWVPWTFWVIFRLRPLLSLVTQWLARNCVVVILKYVNNAHLVALLVWPFTGHHHGVCIVVWSKTRVASSSCWPGGWAKNVFITEPVPLIHHSSQPDTANCVAHNCGEWQEQKGTFVDLQVRQKYNTWQPSHWQHVFLVFFFPGGAEA